VLRLLSRARRVLWIGIGGGGDVVGALAGAELADRLGIPSVVGGTTWERRPIDPEPGPRNLDEVTGARRLEATVALAGPETRGPGGFAFAESHMSRFLGEPTLLIDPGPGPAEVGNGLAHAAGALGCDLVVLLDVGGDALAHGNEAGLASPLCDAVMLAAAPRLASHGVRTIGAVLGAGCDGELEPREVLERLAEVAAAGGSLGAWGIDPAAAERLERAVREVPTEASAQVVACARGALGVAPIRGGARTVERSPLGAVLFGFEPAAALASAARLADAVRGTESLAEAQEILSRRGVRTELDREREVPAHAAPESG